MGLDIYWEGHHKSISLKDKVQHVVAKSKLIPAGKDVDGSLLWQMETMVVENNSDGSGARMLGHTVYTFDSPYNPKPMINDVRRTAIKDVEEVGVGKRIDSGPFHVVGTQG